ncbi:MAG TPA: hypothetical protein VJN96_13980, partial [Vicinamibacterales bacterium]|nr:hypothetical protein [Vicinamibacterales bacterium]
MIGRQARRALVAIFVAAIAAGLAAQAPRPGLPERLSDAEFWSLSQSSSEAGGYFRGENITNLTSNELWFQYVIPDLVARTRPGNVYLGVGPEQNYTYMVATRPKFAVIFDIRRGNLDLQLMYKAIFELSKDGAAFLSMLFSKPVPASVSTRSTAAELFTAFSASQTSQTLFEQNVKAIEQHLTKTHALPLPSDDLAGLEAVYQAFYANGFYVRSNPTYADLMMATDAAGISRSYLATDEGFQFLKDLESRNLVVPVVGDFGGPKAIRAIATYLKARGATVGAFYLSNVEQYLYQDGKWDAFCRSVATLPLDPGSTFIRSSSGGGGGGGR